MTDIAKTLRTLLCNLGDACIGAYSTVPGAPLEVPDLVIPPTGPAPVIDCGNLLIVACTSVTSAFQGPAENCALVLQANLSVTVTRCVSNLDNWGRPADRTAMTKDALGLADDVSTLWYGVAGACKAGTLWTGFTELGCEDTIFRDMRPGAGGGIAWYTWAITVDLSAAIL